MLFETTMNNDVRTTKLSRFVPGDLFGQMKLTVMHAFELTDVDLILAWVVIDDNTKKIKA